MEEAILVNLLWQQVESIRDKGIRDAVKKTLEAVPEAFWKRESSKIYHPEDERGENGNLIHTLRVCKLANRIAETTEMDNLDKDILKASAILHDCLRHGRNGDCKVSTKEHPFLVTQLMKDININQIIIGCISGLIEKHMGRWDPLKPSPTTLSSSDILHIADCLAAQTDIEVKL